MLTYVNGDFVPKESATVSAQDRGFILGDGIFDTWRTLGAHNVRRVVERHLKRLERSINFMELPGEELAREIDAASEELVERNREEIDAAGDVWVHTVVTRGVGREAAPSTEPTRVITCAPINFPALFERNLYEEGAHLVPSMLPRSPFDAVDPRVKSISRLGYVRGERKRARAGLDTWTVLFDNEGFITEAAGASLAIVEGDTVVRAPKWSLLGSISLEIFCELAVGLGFNVEERPTSIYDYLNADEVYVLSTSFCAFPVVDIDGIPVKRAARVGPQIMKAWIEYVGFDFIAQAGRLRAVTTSRSPAAAR